MVSGATHLCEQVGVFTPKAQSRDMLSAGEVGFVVAGVKDLRDARVGDTVTHASRPAVRALPGFKEIKPQVFAGLFPVESNQYEALRDALTKLQLNDSGDALRAGGIAGARLWLPVRLPGPAAHGHRAGAARARVRNGSDHDRPPRSCTTCCCATAR